MTTMRQWWVVPGPAGGVAELRDVPVPEPKPGEVLVKVAGAGTNRGELIGRPALRSDNPRARSAPAGIEFAGTIEAIGASVSGWVPGQRVMGRGSGCYADYTTIDQRALMPTPEMLSDQQAAAIPNVFVTAHDAMATAAGIVAGEAVLITAGSSGVGTAAIQIARHLGADVVAATTRSPAKAEALRHLGATVVVDTGQPDWVKHLGEEVGPMNVVIDQVGGELFPALMTTMAVEARYVSVGRNGGPSSSVDLDLLARNRLHLIGVTFRTRTPDEALACSARFVDELLDRFVSGALRPVVDRTFPLSDLAAAHEYMLGNAQIGKIVLVP